MSKINTINVPFVPTFDGTLPTPEELTEKVKDLPEFKGFRLTEICGSRLHLYGGEWLELGNVATFTKQKGTEEE
jgi:hypothetical protein